MKKMLIVNNNMQVGGVQKSLYNLLWALDAAGGYDVTLLLFSDTGPYVADLPPRVRVVTCSGPFRLFGKSQGECRGAEALIRGLLAAVSRLFGRDAAVRLMLPWQKYLPDTYDVAVAFLHNGRRDAFYGGVQDYVLHRVRATRKVAFLHGDYARCGADHPANHRMLARFDRIAACSDGCRRRFTAALPTLAERCITVPNCHRYDAIRRLAQAPMAAYAPDAVHAVMVARLAHEKGLERAIDAVALAKGRDIPLTLHLVGDGPLRGSLERRAADRGVADRVVFHGGRENPYPYIRCADLLVVASYHEAAPLVIDEAVCLGVPVLTTATISAREMVTDRGVGWVCDNTDDALADALCRLAADPAALAAMRRTVDAAAVDNGAALAAWDALVQH